MRQHTKTTHYNAVAAVMSGCPKRGTASAYGIEEKQLRRLLVSKSTRDAIELFGGRDLFIAKFYEPTKAAAITIKARRGKRGLPYIPE